MQSSPTYITFLRQIFTASVLDTERHSLSHHGTARPHIADGGDGIEIRRVAASILNKQSRAADKGWSYSFEVGRAPKTPHRKKRSLL
jgi:hypothetical protein